MASAKRAAQWFKALPALLDKVIEEWNLSEINPYALLIVFGIKRVTIYAENKIFSHEGRGLPPPPVKERYALLRLAA
jgi:hypothetical protein